MNKTKNEIGATTTDTVRISKNHELMMNNFMPVSLKIGKMDNFWENVTKIDSRNRKSKQFQPLKKKKNRNLKYASHHPS